MTTQRLRRIYGNPNWFYMAFIRLTDFDLPLFTRCRTASLNAFSNPAFYTRELRFLTGHLRSFR